MATATIDPPKRKFRVTLRQPHAEQVRFIESTAKRKVIRAGRRGGKTVGCGALAVRYFLDGINAGHGGRVLYTAPTEDQVAAFWYEVKRALQDPIDRKIFTKNESTHAIELPRTKHRIRAKTAYNAETLRGDFADLLILDEFQLTCEDAWEIVGAPMLLDNDGDAVFVYTPPSLRSSGRSSAIDRRYVSKLYKRAQADTTGRWAAFHFTSYQNPYISTTALAEISSDMTALSKRQEIDAEDIDEVPGALWTRANIESNRVTEAPELVRIVVAVDPSGSDKASADEAGIFVAGKGADGHYYLLEDCTLRGSPLAWAKASTAAYGRWNASKLIAEKNYGGLMVRQTIASVDSSVQVHLINACRGKVVRAEPVASLAEQGRIHHVGSFLKLEDELCSYTGEKGQKSPNRMDACIYTLLELSGRTQGVMSYS